VAELMVADTGIGIPQEDLKLLGTRFHQVSTPGAPSREGTGIGTAHTSCLAPPSIALTSPLTRSAAQAWRWPLSWSDCTEAP
jgi:hypothetical protein